MTYQKPNQKDRKPTFPPFAMARKRMETLFSQMIDQFMLCRNSAKQQVGLFARVISKVSALTVLQYIKQTYWKNQTCTTLIPLKGYIFNFLSIHQRSNSKSRYSLIKPRLYILQIVHPCFFIFHKDANNFVQGIIKF